MIAMIFWFTELRVSLRVAPTVGSVWIDPSNPLESSCIRCIGSRAEYYQSNSGAGILRSLLTTPTLVRNKFQNYEFCSYGLGDSTCVLEGKGLDAHRYM